MISSGGSTGLWKREMTAGGVFLHRCVATNVIGTAMSTNISVSVNGEYIYMRVYKLFYSCLLDMK